MTEPTPSIKIYDEATDTWIFTAGGAGGGGGGASTLDELTDVDAASPAAGDALAWDSGSGQWVPTALNLGGASTLNELTDVNAASPADGDALTWDAGSAQWIPVAASAGPEGPAGPPGTAYMSAQWTFNQNVAAPPVSGGMRYNATTIAATTQVFISETDRDGLDRNAGLNQMVAGDHLMVQSAQGRAVFNITSATDSGTYRTLGVTVAEFTGTRPSASAITTVYSMTGGGEAGGGATGGAVTKSGGFQIHTFTTTSNLVVAGSLDVEVLIVGGGGGGGYQQGGGGGGGGVISQSVTLASGTYPVAIGSAGIGGSSGVASTSGGNSTFNGQTAVGGGGGGSNDGAAAGKPGGSGGGAASGTYAGGAGTAGQGYSGGSTTGTTHNAGAGGGATGAGASASGAGTDIGTKGGVGYSSSISGAAKVYGDGGGGSGSTTYGQPGTTGAGGASGSHYAEASNGSGNGNGGGARHDIGTKAGDGSPGIVIVRYEIAGTALNELIDVNATTPVDGDALIWDQQTSLWVPGAVSVSGGGSPLWAPAVTDPLSSLTGWTVRSGTWSINGGVLRQSDASDGRQRIVRDTGALPVLDAAVRVEARFISGSMNDQRIGLYHGWDGSSSSGGYFGCVQVNSNQTACLAYHENDAQSGGPSTDLGYDTPYDTWFSIGIRRIAGSTADIFINDVLVNSWSGANQQGTRIGFHVFRAAAEFRNLQTWNRAIDVPW